MSSFTAIAIECTGTHEPCLPPEKFTWLAFWRMPFSVTVPSMLMFTTVPNGLEIH